jgi:hypothetical protein
MITIFTSSFPRRRESLFGWQIAICMKSDSRLRGNDDKKNDASPISGWFRA